MAGKVSPACCHAPLWFVRCAIMSIENPMLISWNSHITGETQYISAPVPARLNFDLGLDYRDDEDDVKGLAENDRRLETMLAAQAAFKADLPVDDDEEIAESTTLSDQEKKERLQKALNMAASNGEDDRVRRILAGKPRKYVDVNGPDEEGTSPLIYASCFVGSTHTTIGRKN